ncbi:MAG: hypothetical protein ABIS50_02125 [Luteolibacter sp.]|uniref:hypothetical protein n=1 Tax=Luteolibacter sp. TaxID=1962973 RepID=UPI003263CB15
MKTLLCLVALLFCAVRSEAAYPLFLNGELSWNITEPQAGFKLKGDIQNLSPVGTGPISLILWATKTPYPSQGVIVAHYPLPALPGGSQFSDFTVKTPSDVPATLNGDYYFTIAVVEDVGGTAYNRLLVATGTKNLVNGVFTDQDKWTIPAKPIIDPPAKIKVGDIYTLSEKATGEFNRFPTAWQTEIKLTAQTKTKITFESENRKAAVSYTYAVVKTKLQGKNEWTGKLIMTYGAINNITFKDTVYLYFTGPYSGTYKSTVTGYLFAGDYGKSVTWGTFKLK